jgi:hypothetical protein
MTQRFLNFPLISFPQEFKRFFILKVLDHDYNAELHSPSGFIDKVWHHLLEFPAAYANLCHVATPDKLIDHDPLGASDPDREQRYAFTLDRYDQVRSVRCGAV